MKLLVQPGAGVLPLTKAIAGAKRSVEIAIFRFDRSEVETALAAAIARGVTVRALIAHTNRAGEANLRALETHLLGLGATVARTASDLIRYHAKYMLIDRKELHLLAFNWTYTDMERSRSFGIITRSPAVVREVGKLFDADSARLPFETATRDLVISPVNARKLLGSFIQGARKEILIYDPKVSDPGMVKLLQDRGRAGVKIRILGELEGSIPNGAAHKLANLRLHTRTIIRDGKMAFMGSQSLRRAELESRREVGLIFRDAKSVAKLVETFESDWTAAEKWASQQGEGQPAPPIKIAKRIAKVITREIPPLGPLLNGAVKEIVSERTEVELAPEKMEELVKDAVKAAVKDAVLSVMEGAAAKSGEVDE